MQRTSLLRSFLVIIIMVVGNASSAPVMVMRELHWNRIVDQFNRVCEVATQREQELCDAVQERDTTIYLLRRALRMRRDEEEDEDEDIDRPPKYQRCHTS